MKSFSKKLVLLPIFFLHFCLPTFLFAEVQFDLSLDVIGMMFTGESISKMGYSWSDKYYLKNVPLIPIAMPSLTANVHKKYNPEDMRKLISTSYSWISSLNALGVETGAEYAVSITPLLKLKTFAGVKSAWNYGSSQKGLAVYDYVEKEYVRKTSLSQLAYQFGGEAGVMMPIPKGNMIQGSYSSTYVGFTGAEDKEVWKCGMDSDSVNGWKYRAALMFAHMYKGPNLSMIGITGSATGWYSENDFDDVYEPYKPNFVTFSISPMIQWKFKNKQNLMVSAVISRDRKFENEDYDSSEELLQVYDGTEWKLKTIMCIWHIPLK